LTEIEKLKRENAILRERLFMAKRDTKIRNKRFDNLMAIIFHDKNLGSQIRSKSDLLWDADQHIWNLIAYIVDKYFKSGIEGVPEGMSEEEFDRRKKLMIKACVVKSTQISIAPRYNAEQEEEVKEGIKYLIEYLPHLWI
jgi:hypothetical protein